jgi:hypothetical protein
MRVLIFVAVFLVSFSARADEADLDQRCFGQNNGDACWELTTLKASRHESGIAAMIELSCKNGSKRGCVALARLRQDQAAQAEDDAEIRRVRDLMAIKAFAQ